jgi:hypothetical protein
VVVTDPTTPSTLYAGTNSAGVFKSTDGGEYWSAASTGIGSVPVGELVIDPTNPLTLLFEVKFATELNYCFKFILNNFDCFRYPILENIDLLSMHFFKD